MAVGGAEEHFAKKLANNDKTIRDRAVKRLRAWIASRPPTGTGFSEIELLKIWKGLFYCFWMSDKPLIQEELAENISKLLHSFKNKESGFAFIITFFKTMLKEWHGIDRLRLDKFYLLVRMFIKENFEFLKNNNWDPSICNKLCDIYKDGPLHPSKENVSDGIKLHLCTVFLTELSSVAGEKVSAEMISLLLEPFLILAAQTKSQVVGRAVKEGVLEKLLEMVRKRLNQEDSDDDREDDNEDEKEKMLQINCQAVADKMFSLGSDRHILGRNRKLLYLYSKKLKKAVSDTDENEKERKGRKRKLEQERENEEFPNEEIPVKKIKKKKQEKQQLNGIANCKEVDSEVKEPEVKKKDVKKKKKKRSQADIEQDASEKDAPGAPKMKKRKSKEMLDINGNSEDEINANDSNVKSSIAVQEQVPSQEKSTTVNSEEDVDEVEKEPEVKKKDVRKKKQKRSQADNEQDASEKGAPVTPKMKKKKSKEMLDINGNSEDEIITKDSNVKSSIAVQEQVPSQEKSTISETVVLVEKTIKELRNQVSSAHTMEETPVKKKKKQGVQDNGIPFAAFTKTATPPTFFKKAFSRTEPRKAKTTKLTCPNTDPQNSKKKVTIHLHKNKAQSTADYVKSVTSSPAIPFDAGRTPEFGLLKTKSLTRSKSMKAAKKHTPSKRSKAVDFF